MSTRLYSQLCCGLFALAVLPAGAAPPLRVAAIDSASYPLVVLDGQGRVTGGLLTELGDAIAKALGTKAVHLTWSRRRIEAAVAEGEADISCYSSPQWTDYKGRLDWTVPTLPQIERLVTLKGHVPPARVPDDFLDKRIATMLGYHYASIQPLFNSHQATRVDETRVANLFRLVETGLADALISSEAEIEGYFAQHAGAREKFVVGSATFTFVATQCYVSPKSPWDLASIDKALTGLVDSGEVERMARRYGMSMR